MAHLSSNVGLIGLDEKQIELWHSDDGAAASLYLSQEVRIVFRAAYVDRAETLAGLQALAAVTAAAIAELEVMA